MTGSDKNQGSWFVMTRPQLLQAFVKNNMRKFLKKKKTTENKAKPLYDLDIYPVYQNDSYNRTSIAAGFTIAENMETVSCKMMTW